MRPIGYVIMEKKSGKLLCNTKGPLLFDDHLKAARKRLYVYGGRFKNMGQRINVATTRAEIRTAYIQ